VKRLIATVAVLVTVAATAAVFVGVAAAGEPLSKKQFLKKANAICRDVAEELDAAAEEAFAGVDENEVPPPEALAAFAQDAVPVLRAGIEEIGALEPPRADRKKVDKILKAYTEQTNALEVDPNALATVEDLSNKADKLAKKYGLKACASG
jgi:hypothetical protein